MDRDELDDGGEFFLGGEGYLLALGTLSRGVRVEVLEVLERVFWRRDRRRWSGRGKDGMGDGEEGEESECYEAEDCGTGFEGGDVFLQPGRGVDIDLASSLWGVWRDWK